MPSRKSYGAKVTRWQDRGDHPAEALARLAAKRCGSSLQVLAGSATLDLSGPLDALLDAGAAAQDWHAVANDGTRPERARLGEVRSTAANCTLPSAAAAGAIPAPAPWDGGVAEGCGGADGIGGTEKYVGTFKDKHACAQYVALNYPAANGATFGRTLRRTDGTLINGRHAKWRRGRCYAEFGMASANTNHRWETCLLTRESFLNDVWQLDLATRMWAETSTDASSPRPRTTTPWIY